MMMIMIGWRQQVWGQVVPQQQQAVSQRHLYMGGSSSVDIAMQNLHKNVSRAVLAVVSVRSLGSCFPYRFHLCSAFALSVDRIYPVLSVPCVRGQVQILSYDLSTQFFCVLTAGVFCEID